MAYDPVRKVTVLFGGSAPGGDLADLWEWDGTAWSTPVVGQPWPTARHGHAMAYVPARHAVVMIGGRSADGPGSEYWEWDGTTWTQLTATAVPENTVTTSIAVDATQGIVVLAATTPGPNVETWQLGAAGWERRATTGLSADARIAWDPITRHVIAFGSGTDPGELGTHSWDGTRWTQLPDSQQPGQRRVPTLATHGAIGRVVLVGGRRGNEPLETCDVCPEDCDPCPTLCGDGRCTDGEDCPGDCGA